MTFNRGLLANIGFIESIIDTLSSGHNFNRTVGHFDLRDSYWDCKNLTFYNVYYIFTPRNISKPFFSISIGFVFHDIDM
jgi:hypothetical protein